MDISLHDSEDGDYYSLFVLKTRDLVSIESSFIKLSFAFIHSSQVVSKVPNTLDGFFLQILENFRKQNTSNFRDTLRVFLIFLTTQSSVGLGATKILSLINWTICHMTTNLSVCVLNFFVRNQKLHAILITNLSFTFFIFECNLPKVNFNTCHHFEIQLLTFFTRYMCFLFSFDSPLLTGVRYSKI